MWLELFTIASAIAVCLSVAAVVIQMPASRSLRG
jgi:hypothetical protein